MNNMRISLLLASILIISAACASAPRQSDAVKLAQYQMFSGEPVRSINYSSVTSPGFSVVDDEHVLLETRPSEAYLLTLSGPCLEYDRGSPVLGISSQFGRISAGFDRVTVGSQPSMSCIVKEIRPVDLKAMREAEKAATGTS